MHAITHLKISKRVMNHTSKKVSVFKRAKHHVSVCFFFFSYDETWYYLCEQEMILVHNVWNADTALCAKQIRSTIVLLCSFYSVMRSFHSIMYSSFECELFSFAHELFSFGYELFSISLCDAVFMFHQYIWCLNKYRYAVF